MAEVKGANVTKYDAGGTGDNLISDGYIKTVEKVWIDSYTFTAAAIPSGTTLVLAVLPPNKKVTGIDLFFTSLSTDAAGTCTTISLGDAGSATRFLAATDCTSTVLNLSMNAQGGFAYSTDGTLRILATFGRKATITTTGTIKWRVRYT